MTQEVTFGELSFKVIRTERRRTVAIVVDRDGKLALAAPPWVPTTQLEGYVNSRREWIYSKLDVKAMNLAKQISPRRFVEGEGFWYLGRKHRLKLVASDGVRAPLRLNRGSFELTRGRETEGRDVFIAWYRGRLRPIVERLSDEYSQKHGVEHSGVRILSLGHRWGSCGKYGRLNYHWRTAMLPAELMEYVVAHEVSHLVEEKHAPAFWNSLEEIMPDYRARRHTLALDGVQYDL